MSRIRCLVAVVFLCLASPALGLEIKQGMTTLKAGVLLVSSTDHITPVTGATVTVTRSKNGSAFAALSGTVAETGNGWYDVTFAAGDVDTLGDLKLHATATGADPADRLVGIVAYDATDAAALGLSRLDAAVSSRMASGATVAANITQIAGQTASAAAGVTFPASISSYAGADTSGTTTLLARIPGVVQPQTGDSYGRIGAAGAGLTSVVLAQAFPANFATLAINGSGFVTPTTSGSSGTISIGIGTISTVTDATHFTIVGVNIPGAINTAIQPMFFQTGLNKFSRWRVASYSVSGSVGTVVLSDTPPNVPSAGDTVAVP